MLAIILLTLSIFVPMFILSSRIGKLEAAVRNMDYIIQNMVMYKINKIIPKVTGFEASPRTLGATFSAVIEAAAEQAKVSGCFDITDEEWLVPVVERALLETSKEEEDVPGTNLPDPSVSAD